MALKSLEDIADAVRLRGAPPRVAIARCAEEFVLRAAFSAHARGVAEPVFLGDMDATRKTIKGMDDVPDINGFHCEHITDDAQAVARAVELFRTGEASLIMKGLVATATLLRAVLDKETGVPPKGLLSHVTVFRSPMEDRLMVLTDAGVNIKPNLQRKVDILENALAVARAVGIRRPRVAALAATEKVNYPAMPATLDAQLLAQMSDQGRFGDAIVAGPLSLDLAVSPASARCKGLDHPVAGAADVLLAPDIESGNMIYKALNSWCGAVLASVVVGSAVPVVVPSRADSDQSKFHSMALAAYLSGAGKGGQTEKTNHHGEQTS